MRAKQAMLTYLHKHNVFAEIKGNKLMSHDKEIKTMRDAIETGPDGRPTTDDTATQRCV